MRTLLLAVVAALLAPTLAGCIAQPAVTGTPEATSALPNLSDVQEPDFDLGGARMWWEGFVNGFPYRHAGSPTNVEASERIAADLEAIGWEARTFYFIPSSLRGVPIVVGSGPSPVDEGIRVVVGMKEGTVEPERVIAWVSHYDSHQAAPYAAYDDGSGNAVGIELARALNAYDNRKTLMAIFFDAEEVGLVASQAFVQQALRDPEVKFDMVIGHDMVGINCPGHDWPMYQMVGENFADVLVPIQMALYGDFLSLDVGFGEDATNCVVVLDVHDRNSDERNFKEADIPILRMAGGRKAADYPAYHMPNDTVDHLYTFVGGPENFEKGLETVLRTSWWNVVVFDRLPSLV